MSQPGPQDSQKPGEQARYTVNIFDQERKLIRSDDEIKYRTAYDCLADLQNLIWLIDDLCSNEGGRWSLGNTFGMARLAVGKCDFIEVKLLSAQNSKIPAVSPGENGQPTVIVNTGSKETPQAENPGIRQAIGSGISSLLASRVVQMEKKVYPMQRLREAKDPLETVRLLGPVGLEIDKWFWDKVVPYYDKFVKDPAKSRNIVYECNKKVKTALQQWHDAALSSLSLSELFHNDEMLDKEGRVAQAEAIAKQAEFGAPRPQEVPRASV